MEGELEWEGEVDSGLVTRPRRSKAEKMGVEEEMAENSAEVTIGEKENGVDLTKGEKANGVDLTNGEKANGADHITKGEKENGAEESVEVTYGKKENGAEESVQSQGSVYLDASQGLWKCRDCTWTYKMENPGIDNIQNHNHYFHQGIETTVADVGNNLETLFWPVADRKQENGTAFKDKDVTNQNGYSILNNHKQSDVAEIEVEKTEPQKSATKELLPAKQHNKVKQETAEYDLERIIEEQETHDLYCPNCHSCITKRVILRKRKRLGRVVEREAKPEKLTRIEPVLGGSAAGSGGSDQSQEPDVFRCLSCFSFFISTASGFRLFRIFQRRGENDNLQTPNGNLLTPQPPPAQNLNATTSTPQSVREPGGYESNVGLGSDIPLSGEDNLRTHPVVNTVGLGSAAPLSKEGKETTEVALKHPGSDPVPIMEGVGSYFSSTATNVTEENKRVLPTQEANYPDNVLSNVGKQGEVAEGGNYNKSSSQESMLLVGKAEANGGQKVLNGAEVFFSGNGIIPHTKEDEINGWNPSSNLSQNLLGEKVASVPSTPEVSDAAKPLQDGMADPTELLVSQPVQDPPVSSMPAVSSGRDIQLNLGDPRVVGARRREWDVLKSVVYGGLVESITSLGVVSSAAGSDATSLKIVALGLANLVAGLIVLAHNLKELTNDHQESLEPSAEENTRYYRTLGRIANKRLHVFVAILCYILFGIIPPVVYGFSFRKSDNKEYKLIAVAGASLLCILLLSIGKAHVQRGPKPYIKTIFFYLSMGVASSGLAYVAGDLVKKLLENSGLFDSSDAGSVPSPPSLLDMRTTKSGWGSF
ncbi:hypothetical protein H6P81_008243 [Aristolochia fimbriata]|uniref:Membrane protein of ER body-like protein n=1 Tax=Aristolochia fimbriata TaxID=158543 RepID=A0AAV7F363_ARIFI|nr:hypothetical protein H6P81_008243 [Aristolochia fimbriata]